MIDRQQEGRESARCERGSYTITRRQRHWEVRDPAGDLVCLTVYKCGAQEVVRRLDLRDESGNRRVLESDSKEKSSPPVRHSPARSSVLRHKSCVSGLGVPRHIIAAASARNTLGPAA